MLTVRNVYRLQSEYSVADGSFRDSEVSFEEYVAQCRTFISANLPEDYTKGNLDSNKKVEVVNNLVSTFVDKHPISVKGYVSNEGILDRDLLLQDLTGAVTGVYVIEEALDDPEVDEIQINDAKTIFVSKKGVLVPYNDSRGRVMQFSNNDEIHMLIHKLIDDGTGNSEQFTEGNPILNARTAKHQYRINAVHHVANTMDKPPYSFPITSVVIRKFKEVKLTIDDLIEFGAVTEKMGKLLTLLGQAELKLFCVGPTGSGKTTLLNIIASTIPKDKRIILVQNPTEISFQDRDQHGRNIRNVVHWEVTSKVSLSDLISNTLRATPEVIIVGEAREPKEFQQIHRAMRTGHKVLSTFHAEDARDGIMRFASELSSVSGISETEAVRSVARSIDIIISQFRFPDGRRRVMEIAEVQGVDNDGEVKINKLFEFKLSGETRRNDYGLVEVLGEFKQVGILSERIQQTFYKAGISRSQIEEFLTLEDA